MKKSLRAGGGFLEIDHRDSPGLTAADVATWPGMTPVPGGTRLETDIYQCSHCQRGIVLHSTPERIHRRGYCPKCDHYICNACERLRVATGECRPFEALVDRILKSAQKGIVITDSD